MRPPKLKNKLVFKTPWFQILSARRPGSRGPFYTIQSPDFVAVVATTEHGDLLLVRQFRAAVARTTLELPSGHVDHGETPMQAARRELLEETGYEAGKLERLAVLSPSTARFTNRLWCFFAANARPRRGARLEPGVGLVVYRGKLASLLKRKEFCSAASYGVLFTAVLRGKLAA